MESKPQNTARDLLRARFPELSDAQVDEAAEQLRGYVAFLLRLSDSILSDPERYARFKDLTKSQD